MVSTLHYPCRATSQLLVNFLYFTHSSSSVDFIPWFSAITLSQFALLPADTIWLYLGGFLDEGQSS